MRLVLRAVEARVGAVAASVPLDGAGRVGTAGLEIEVEVGDRGMWPSITWSVANRGEAPAAVRHVALVFTVEEGVAPIRMFRNGYQSWSPSGVATLGRDIDPSSRARFEFLQAVHHADQRAVEAPGELRSEWVTVVAAAAGPPILIGFLGGHDHDGTLRLRPGTDGVAELRAEAFLGDAVLAPGERRRLHPVVIDAAGTATAGELLERWAGAVGPAAGARVEAAYQVGWCSWYQYFHDVTESDLTDNLARADEWPFEVFQLDDGYQAAIGDWLRTNRRFPSGLDAVAERIHRAGYRPGLWMAPFLAAPDSELARRHPDWLAGRVGAERTAGDGFDEPLFGWWNPPWGGGRDGFMYALDTTHPGVLAHLEELARQVVALGFTYLKLDFTFAPSLDGRWADPSRTPAQRVRLGYEAIRRGAGDVAFILGCGVPLAHVVGLVDGVRIGADVAPTWSLAPDAEIVAGYLGIQPATRHAYANTLTRSFMHRRLWLNDPDCVMLRSTDTALGPDQVRTWARCVGLSGGMALVSDDLALLGPDAHTLLDETLELGRASDNAARAGRTPATPDLMDADPPTTFTANGRTLETDPDTGRSSWRASG